jgi:hypothetical protein
MELHENHWADDGGAQLEEDIELEEDDEKAYVEWFKEDWALENDWNKIEPVEDYEKLEDGGI